MLILDRLRASAIPSLFAMAAWGSVLLGAGCEGGTGPVGPRDVDGGVDSGVIRVPEQAPTIRGALSLTQGQSTIVVAPGIYRETGLVLPARVALVAADTTAGATVIEGDGIHPILTVSDGERAAYVSGFTFRFGPPERLYPAPAAGAIDCAAPWMEVLSCRFEAYGRRGGAQGDPARSAIHAKGTVLRLTDCLFDSAFCAVAAEESQVLVSHSQFRSGGRGITLSGGSLEAYQSIFRSHREIAIEASAGVDAKFDQCRFEDNGRECIQGVGCGDLELTNCLVRGTSSPSYGAWLVLWGGATVNVELCRFESGTIGTLNSAATMTTIRRTDFAGAVGVRLNSAESNLTDCAFDSSSGRALQVGRGSTRIENCRFRGNRNGALELLNSGTVFCTSCDFDSNRAENGAAIRSEAAFAEVTDCVFRGNLADADGGAITIGRGTVSRCRFFRNQAGERGGAVLAEGRDFVIDRSVFAWNEAAKGGAIAFASRGICEYATFHQNRAVSGSAVFAGEGFSGYATIFDGGFGGGPIVSELGALLLTGSDVWGNEGGDYVGAISDQLGMRQNIHADPLFCAPAEEDFGIYMTSECHDESQGNMGGVEHVCE